MVECCNVVEFKCCGLAVLWRYKMLMQSCGVAVMLFFSVLVLQHCDNALHQCCGVSVSWYCFAMLWCCSVVVSSCNVVVLLYSGVAVL